MGTARKTYRDERGQARPSISAQEVELLEEEAKWIWTGELTHVELYAYAERLTELHAGDVLGPLVTDGEVVATRMNEVVGGLPAEPSAAVAEALAVGRAVAIQVMRVDAAATSVAVKVTVAL